MATRARLLKNCVQDPSKRRKRQTESGDQLEPLNNNFMFQAVASGVQRINQVSLMSPFLKVLLRFHHISHHQHIYHSLIFTRSFLELCYDRKSRNAAVDQ